MTGRATVQALTLAVVLSALLCATAAASTAGKSGSTLEYNAVAGETNSLTLSRQGASYVFTDTGTTITPLAGCAMVNANQVTCAAAGINRIQIALDDMGDQLTVSGQVPASSGISVFAGTGNDVLSAGPGDAMS